jgi:hypothetical protein
MRTTRATSSSPGGRRPEYKGPRVQEKVIMTPEARRTLKTLAHRRKLPMGEFLEALIREEYGKG